MREKRWKKGDFMPSIQTNFTVMLMVVGLMLNCPDGFQAFGLDTEKISSAVCTIVASNRGKKISIGTGFFVSLEGHILTNSHVVPNGADEYLANCEAGMIEFTRREIIRAPDEDLAVVSTSQSRTPFLKLSYESPSIRVGQQVTVVGAALGLDWTFSSALVSRLSTEGGSVALQISGPVNPGNSGGPVISANGTVIGIIQSKIATAEGIAFAIPSFRMWHYDEFYASMKNSQERMNFNYMPADKRRMYFDVNMGSIIPRRIRTFLDWCLDGKGMAPTRDRDACSAAKSVIGKNAKFLLFDSHDDFGINITKIFLENRPDLLVTIAMRIFSGEDYQIINVTGSNSHNHAATAKILSQWHQDPLVWF
jgi:hypothetical protein